jgi:hypothetical protein
LRRKKEEEEEEGWRREKMKESPLPPNPRFATSYHVE